MTLAMMYPVDTQEISSSVAPRFPIMCGIATFTIEVSISSSTAASVTAIAIRYLYLYLSTATIAPEDGPERSVILPDAPPGRTVVAIAPRLRGLLDVHVRR